MKCVYDDHIQKQIELEKKILEEHPNQKGSRIRKHLYEYTDNKQKYEASLKWPGREDNLSQVGMYYYETILKEVYGIELINGALDD